MPSSNTSCLDGTRVEALDFDAGAARAYARVCARVTTAGRTAREQRSADLLVAATGLAANVPLYTRNPTDCAVLSGLLEVVSADSAARL